MIRILNHSSARKALLIGLVLVVAVVGTSFLRPTATATAPQSVTAIYPQLIRIWMHGDQVYSSVTRARAGKILLRTENQTQSDVRLVLELLLPGGLRQITARINTVSRALRAEQILTLVPGEYEFYDETFPEARGKLIILP